MTDRIDERDRGEVDPTGFAGGEIDEVAPEDVDLTCDNCGAAVTWDPETDALACEHCGHTETVERGEGTVLERPLAEAGAAARGFGVELRVTRCETCGARVTFEGSSTSDACVFCGSANVLDQEASRNQIRPESLIPLDVSEDRVRTAFRSWIDGLWFRPSALKQQKEFAAVGVYVPTWTFDCDVRSRWTADSGTYYWVNQRVTVMVNGTPQTRTRRVRKIRWRPARGKRRDEYDDLQVIASMGVCGDLALKLGPYDTTKLVPYRPEYLAGWRAEEYQVDLEAAWQTGLARVVDSQKRRCGSDVPGDTYRRLEVRNDVRDVYWKHALLPMWTLTYTFKGKSYPVLVHGQTGNVVGDAPLSWVKILLLVLGIATVVLAIVAAANA
ncbi:MAG: hypothetical protein GY711_00390 [bacterium]|nr:hypothetical protein [bacterium]